MYKIGAREKSIDDDPVGRVDQFTGDLPGDNWLILDGQTITRAGHPELFAARGWSGTSASLPDYRGVRVLATDPVTWAIKARRYTLAERPSGTGGPRYADAGATFEAPLNHGTVQADRVLEHVEETRGGDVDVHRFALAVPSDIAVTVIGGLPGTLATLYNAARLELASGRPVGDVIAFAVRDQPAGTYYLRIASPLGGLAEYRMVVSTVAGSYAEFVAPGLPAAARPANPTPDAVVRSATELANAYAAGKRAIAIAPGVYADWRLRLNAGGTSTAPLHIFAQTPGGPPVRGSDRLPARPGADSGVIFKGNSWIDLVGPHIRVDDITWDGCASDELAYAQCLQLANTGCHARYHRFYNCGAAVNGYHKGVIGVVASSRLCLVADNYVSGAGCLPIVQRIEGDRVPDNVATATAPHGNFPYRNDFRRNVIQDVVAPEEDTAGAAIQIGQGNLYAGMPGRASDGFDVERVPTEISVTYNFVRSVQRLAEAVSIRSSKCRVAFNEAHRLAGRLRVAGDENTVDGNLAVETHGFALEGAGHLFLNNDLRDTLRRATDGAVFPAVALVQGGRNVDGTRRARAATACKLLYNTIRQNGAVDGHAGCIGSAAFDFAVDTPSSGNVIKNNIFLVRGGEAVSDPYLDDRDTFDRNLIWGLGGYAALKIGPADRVEDPLLDYAPGFPVPAAGSPARGGADPSFGVVIDITGAAADDDWLGCYRAGSSPASNAAPVWVTPSGLLRRVQVDKPLSPAIVLLATDPEDPVTVRVAAGALPPGLGLSGSSIVGTPTAPGAYAFTASADDGANSPVVRAFSIEVEAAAVNLPPTWVAPAAGALPAVDAAVPMAAVTLNATDPSEVVTFTLRAGSPPPGVTVVGNKLQGTPAAASAGTTYAFEIGASDGINTPVTRAFSLEVRANLAPDAASSVARWALVGGAGSATLSGGRTVLTLSAAGSYLAYTPPGSTAVTVGATYELQIQYSSAQANCRPTFGLRQTDGNYEEGLMVAPAVAPNVVGTLSATYTWKKAHSGFHIFRRKDWAAEAAVVTVHSVVLKKK